MHEIEFLKVIVVIFGLASLVIFIFNKLKLPSVIGFLLTGIIAGPYALGLISNLDIIDVLAEIGVILLLFIIGMEFSIRKLMKIRNIVFIGGMLQVGITILVVMGILHFFTHVPYNQAVFIGFLVALSSTAIILKVLQEKDQVETHHGKISLGILIFQDLIIVPMMLFIPFLSGESSSVGSELLFLLVKSITLLGVTFVFARWVIPYVLHKIAISNSQELFLIAIIVIGFAIASFSAWLGLSLALGAFLAGLAISESSYSYQAIGNIIPFRDVFASFFFVSIGMLLDLHFFIDNWITIVTITIILITLKSIIIGIVSFVLGYPFRIAFRSGLILSQIGEFSFILAKMGLSKQLIDNHFYQIFLAVAILSMSVTPVFIIFSKPITTFFEKIPMPLIIRNGLKKLPKQHIPKLSGHTVLVGTSQYTSLMRSMELANIPFVIIDTDADLVRDMQKQGINAVYGDAQYKSVLEEASVKDASSMLLYVEGTSHKATIIKTAKTLNPKLHTVVRTRYIDDLEYLYEVGADDVIPIEFEAFLEMFSRALNHYLIPNIEIERLLAKIRANGYKAFRSNGEKGKAVKLSIPDFEINTMTIHKDSLAYNKSIKELDLRNKTGISILAIKRQDELHTNPSADFVLKGDDIIYTLGDHYNATCLNEIFKHG
ncbi:MAG: cation:proton antiporter [Bacteroidales bacterium]|nr:cation:proton antiporter [Bacteroidales bacterium]MDD3891425.1 cation:proton antiporter [Bacteroidales bacterium]